MTTLIFAVGILVFLVTVYGTVISGGLLLTGRQLVEEPGLIPPENGGAPPEKPPLVPSNY